MSPEEQVSFMKDPSKYPWFDKLSVYLQDEIWKIIGTHIKDDFSCDTIDLNAYNQYHILFDETNENVNEDERDEMEWKKFDRY